MPDVSIPTENPPDNLCFLRVYESQRDTGFAHCFREDIKTAEPRSYRKTAAPGNSKRAPPISELVTSISQPCSVTTFSTI